MKSLAHLLLAGLLSATLVQDSDPRAQDGGQETKKKSNTPVKRAFQEEGERVSQEVQGSWMLMDYTDPSQQPFGDAVSGFATFHDGFLTMMIAVNAVERRLFRSREHVFLSSGAYRYRFDEHATLQLASVMSFSNDNEDGSLESEPAGMASEYYAKLEDGLLELRDRDGVEIRFRQIESGVFPDSAVRKLEGRRGGADGWEKDD